MKISDELIGKDVIDESGDQVGLVKDVEWDLKPTQ
ncbi:MAG: PRC-barrel domain-containing protein [Methanobacterium sp.]